MDGTPTAPDATSGARYGALNAGQVIRVTGDLALYLGGSGDSFTGMLLNLAAKTDPGNRARLRAAFPREITAYETWMRCEPPPTAAELAAQLAGPPPVPPDVTPDGDAEAMRWLHRLIELEAAGERTPVEIGPYALFTMIGALQMVVRHPGIGGRVRAVLVQLIETWRTPFDGTIGEQLIDQGFDPAYDDDGRHPRAGV